MFETSTDSVVTEGRRIALIEICSTFGDVVYFEKDADGRYTLVSPSILLRCGAASVDDVVGRDPTQVFADPFGQQFRQQDLEVLGTGRSLERILETHPYAGGKSGWCVTHKHALRGERGEIIGVVGFSRDMGELDSARSTCRAVASVVDHMHREYADQPRIAELAAMVGVSVSRLERAFRRIYGSTPSQMLTRIRMDAAAALIRGGVEPIREVARRCGYSDHSSFTRQFRTTHGLPPSALRLGH